MQLKITKLINPDGLGGLTPPLSGDTGYDLAACEPASIFSGEQVEVRTGIRIEIPEGYVGIIRERGSFAKKRIYAHGGVIDPSFRGEITLFIENRSGLNYHIEPGERVAQILLVAVARPDVVEVDESELSTSRRGVLSSINQ